MSNDFDLTIELPTRTFLNTKAQGVILPAVRADVEILPERAPSVFVLDYGLLQILSAKGEVLERYFIYSGVADVAENSCKVMTQDVVPYGDIGIASAKEKMAAAKDDNERLFYAMIVNYLVGTRKRYLRTLNVFSRKKARLFLRSPNRLMCRRSWPENRKTKPRSCCQERGFCGYLARPSFFAIRPA